MYLQHIFLHGEQKDPLTLRVQIEVEENDIARRLEGMYPNLLSMSFWNTSVVNIFFSKTGQSYV